VGDGGGRAFRGPRPCRRACAISGRSGGFTVEEAHGSARGSPSGCPARPGAPRRGRGIRTVTLDGALCGRSWRPPLPPTTARWGGSTAGTGARAQNERGTAFYVPKRSLAPAGVASTKDGYVEVSVSGRGVVPGIPNVASHVPNRADPAKRPPPRRPPPGPRDRLGTWKATWRSFRHPSAGRLAPSGSAGPGDRARSHPPAGSSRAGRPICPGAAAVTRQGSSPEASPLRVRPAPLQPATGRRWPVSSRHSRRHPVRRRLLEAILVRRLRTSTARSRPHSSGDWTRSFSFPHTAQRRWMKRSPSLSSGTVPGGTPSSACASSGTRFGTSAAGKEARVCISRS